MEQDENSICRGMNDLEDEPEASRQQKPSFHARLSIDCQPLKNQLDAMVSLFPPESIPDQFIHDLGSMGLQVIFGESTTTLGTDGVLEIRQAVRLSGCLEDIAATLRASIRDSISHD
ncbi:MAG TPA: hypothetical protein VGE89_04895 [Bryobacteraceae bacterium]|jgi:hypothetical protein